MATRKKQDTAPPDEELELTVGTIEADVPPEAPEAPEAEEPAPVVEPETAPESAEPPQEEPGDGAEPPQEEPGDGAEPPQEEAPLPEENSTEPPQEPPTAPETAEPEENVPAPAEDERAALARERAEFEQEKLAFAHQQLVTSVAGVLQDKGIPVEFAPWITGADAETSAANVEALEAALGKYFDLRLAERMRGGNPPPAGRDHAYSRDKLRGMSAAEINAQWADISAALSRR